jgi:hypothetical protein
MSDRTETNDTFDTRGTNDTNDTRGGSGSPSTSNHVPKPMPSEHRNPSQIPLNYQQAWTQCATSTINRAFKLNGFLFEFRVGGTFDPK